MAVAGSSYTFVRWLFVWERFYDMVPNTRKFPLYNFGLLALAHLQHTVFRCKRMGIPSFDYNKYVFHHV